MSSSVQSTGTAVEYGPDSGGRLKVNKNRKLIQNLEEIKHL